MQTTPPTSTPSPTTESEHIAALSEAEFLRSQADHARKAMQKAFARMSSELGQAADPRVWAGAHPWIALGGAMAAGFATASTVVPSREEQALERLKRIERALHPERFEHPQPAPEAAAAKTSIWSALLMEAVTILKPAIYSAISASRRPADSTDDQPDSDYSSTAGDPFPRPPAP